MNPVHPFAGASSTPTILAFSFESVIVATIVTIIIGAVILFLARRRLVTRHASGSDQRKIGRALFASYCVSLVLNPLLFGLFKDLVPIGIGRLLFIFFLLPSLSFITIFRLFAGTISGFTPGMLRKSHYITASMLAFASVFIIPILWVFWMILAVTNGG